MSTPSTIRPLGGAACWRGAELQRSGIWLREWSQACLNEFDRAVENAEKHGLA